MYERSDDLFQLALWMEGSHGGVSIQEIAGELGVSRRTAERLRDAVCRAFPSVEEVPTGERVKRWRLPTGGASRLAELEAADLEEVALAAERLRGDGLGPRAAQLDRLRVKLSALMQPALRRRVEPDLEALLESEGHAMRPGPRPVVPDGLLDRLRHALLGCLVVRVSYRGRGSGRVRDVLLEPHGVLLGHRHYLVARESGRVDPNPKLYALSNIVSAEATEDAFTRLEGFDLRAYAARAFGVYQEEPVEVVWRFAPAHAADALEHHFHPTERKSEMPDGSVEVSFTAGGEVEMAWHLFTWGSGVELVAPASLRERYARMLGEALRALGAQDAHHHRGAGAGGGP